MRFSVKHQVNQGLPCYSEQQQATYYQFHSLLVGFVAFFPKLSELFIL